MLGRDIAIPEGWQLAWIQRTLVPLILSCQFLASIPLLVSAVSDTTSCMRVRKLCKQMTVKPPQHKSEAEEFFAQIRRNNYVHDRIKSFSDGSYPIGIALVFSVDAWIVGAAFWKAAKGIPWNTWLVACTLDGLYFLCVALPSFFIVPLIMVLCIMGLAIESGEAEGSTSLSESASNGLPWYAPISIRLFNMHAFQLLVGISPLMKLPVDKNPIWRCFVVSTCLGMFVALHCLRSVSKYCVKELEDLRWREPGCRGILGLFKQVVCIFKDLPQAKRNHRLRRTTIQSDPEKLGPLEDIKGCSSTPEITE